MWVGCTNKQALFFSEPLVQTNKKIYYKNNSRQQIFINFYGVDISFIIPRFVRRIFVEKMLISKISTYRIYRLRGTCKTVYCGFVETRIKRIYLTYCTLKCNMSDIFDIDFLKIRVKLWWEGETVSFKNRKIIIVRGISGRGT